jgi:antitoxin CptB
MNTNTRAIEISDEATRRMEWRCRRGMLELDLLFNRFVNVRLQDLNHLQIEALNELLELPDNELWKLIASSDCEKSKSVGQVLNMLRGLVVHQND